MNESQIKYKTIVADPPWKYGPWGGNSGKTEKCLGFKNRTESRPIPYPTMTIEEICGLPVATLADENCDLYLWTTQKYLRDAFSVLDAWGFKYCQTLAWCKAPRGTGQGGLFCPTTEFILLGRKGAMPKNKKRQDSTWWKIKRHENFHSAKPGFFMELIESMSDSPRLEMFARSKRDGWHSWGNEVPNDVEITAPNPAQESAVG